MVYSSQLEKMLKPRKLIIKIFWCAITVLILIFTLIAYYFSSHSSDYLNSKSLEITLKYFFYGMGLIIAISFLIYKKIIFSEKKIINRLKIKVNLKDYALNPETNELDQDKLNRLSELSESELKLISLTGWYFARFVMLMAICGGISTLGFLLAIESMPSQVLPLISLILCLTSYNGLDRIIQKGNTLLKDPRIYTS